MNKQGAGAPRGNQNAVKKEDKKRKSKIYIYCTPSEKAICVKAADGRTLSDWGREKLGLDKST